MNSVEERYTYLRNIFPQKDAFYMRRMTIAHCQTQEELTNFVENALAGVFPQDTVPTENEADDLDPDLEAQRQFFISLLPDADRTYMTRKFKELAGKPYEIDIFIGEKTVTQEYPKAGSEKGNIPPTVISANTMAKREVFNMESFLKAIPDPRDHFSKKGIKSDVYKDKALDYLKSKHSNLPASAISEALELKDFSLYRAYKHLIEKGHEVDETVNSPPIEFDECPRLKQEIAFIENEDLVNEFLEEKRALFEEERLLAEASGLLIPCETCFCSQPASVFKTCREGHLFCMTCLQTAFTVRFSEGTIDYLCFSENCESTFSEDVLREIMSPVMFSNHLRRLTSRDILEANIENIVKCPFCDSYMAIPAPEDKIFKCLNLECMVESCLQCHLKAHIPYECHEKEEKAEKMRLEIEASMDQAVIRTCCNNSFMKEDGCNRLQCPTCKAFRCYICREKVADDYKHFYGQNTASSDIQGRCPLFSNINELHVDAVAVEAQRARSKVMDENPGIQLIHDPTEILPERVPESTLPGM